MGIDPKAVTAVIVTRGDCDLTAIKESLKCFKETWVYDNSKQPDRGVWGRYAYVNHLDPNTVFYTQDDDCLVENPAEICLYYEPGTVTCNMPPEYRSNYADGMGIALVGFGAIFDSRLARAAFEQYNASSQPLDDLFRRECDRVFTALNQTKLVDLPFDHLPNAHGMDRLYRHVDHLSSLEEIRRRIKSVKGVKVPEVDILYCAWERPEFTKLSHQALLDNTDMTRVGRFVCYDDFDRKFGSPVAIMRDFLSTPGAPIIAKVDNDLIVCPGWLDEGLRLMAEHPEVSLLGIEPHVSHDPGDGSQPSDIQYCGHIGGIGFMRREAFRLLGGPQVNGQRHGFTEWQWNTPSQLKAWIHPPLPVFLLDHLPMEPYRTLSREYEAKGWQRPSWGEYPPEASKLWEWWLKDLQV